MIRTTTPHIQRQQLRIDFFHIVKEQPQHPKRTLATRNSATPTRYPYLPIPSNGGANRDRTGDLLLAKQALSQLSYSPLVSLVGLDGFEPSTPRLSSVCSNQLSYRPAGQTRQRRFATHQHPRARAFGPLDSQSMWALHAP